MSPTNYSPTYPPREHFCQAWPLIKWCLRREVTLLLCRLGFCCSPTVIDIHTLAEAQETLLLILFSWEQF